LLAKSNVLEKEYFNFLKKSSPESGSSKLKTIAEVEKIHIENVLDELKWNKSKASRVLGITKTTLYNKIALYNITPKKP
jgi:DNA-binding NtrC family response regulator